MPNVEQIHHNRGSFGGQYRFRLNLPPSDDRIAHALTHRKRIISAHTTHYDAFLNAMCATTRYRENRAQIDAYTPAAKSTKQPTKR